MSCYGWERGTITIPSTQWASFRKGLLAKWNAKQEEVLDLAKRAHKAAKDACKGKRGRNRKQAMLEAVARECGGKVTEYGDFEATRRRRSHGFGFYDEYDSSAQERWNAVLPLIFKERLWNVRYEDGITLQAPKKKDLDLHPVSKGCTVMMPEASITFNNKTRTVTWDVPENNRSVDRAREHWFAGEFFKALGKIEWTVRSGGQIVGNDEYNRDSREGGAGGNYVVATYSKKQQKAEREAARRERSYYGSYGRRW